MSRCPRPDIIHIHWANTAIRNAPELAGSKLPITARYHGFEVNAEAMRAALALPGIQRIFCFPHQLGLARGDPRFRAMNVAFDTALFGPSEDKDSRLVLRSCAARPSRDLATFFDIAKRLPNHHFVLAVVTCKQTESYVDEVRALWRTYGQPGELIVDMPRDGIVQLMKRAGLYLHTIQAPASTRTPVGMPISIAESMATGAHVLARGIPPFATYVGGAGQVYRDADHATELIEQTISWSEEEWSGSWMRSVDCAFTKYADGTALHPLYDEWCAIVAKPQIPPAN